MQWKWYKNGSSSLDKTSQVFDFESRTQAINMKFIALFFVLVAVIATQAAPSSSYEEGEALMRDLERIFGVTQDPSAKIYVPAITERVPLNDAARLGLEQDLEKAFGAGSPWQSYWNQLG